MNILVAITGASGAIYAQRLLEALAQSSGTPHTVHVLLSSYARQVIAEEIGELRVPQHFVVHGDKSMNVPFASGSSRWDRMVIIPCTMGTVGRIANGVSDSTITRTADVFLKERRKLIIVPRETPWNLIHARNIVTLMEAGADVIPAMPSFYSHPQTVMDVVDTVVARVLDHMDVEHTLSSRWMDQGGEGERVAPAEAGQTEVGQTEVANPQGEAPRAPGAQGGLTHSVIPVRAPVTGRRSASRPPQPAHAHAPHSTIADAYAYPGAEEQQEEDASVDNRRTGAFMQILHEDEAPAPPPMAPPTADTLAPEPPFWEISGDREDDRRAQNHKS